MAEVIRLNSTNNGTYNVTLNGTVYFLRAYWNKYANRWFLDFLDSDNNPIIMGLAIVAGIKLFRARPALCLQIGDLVAFDLTGNDCQNRDELGSSTILVYFLPGEFDTLFPDYYDVPYRPLGYTQEDFDSVLQVV